MSRGLGISVRLEPWRMASRHSVSAKMWVQRQRGNAVGLGHIANLGQCGVNQASACKVAATMLRWVSTAPLDRPVVPPVYCKRQSNRAWRCWARGAPLAQARAF